MISDALLVSAYALGVIAAVALLVHIWSDTRSIIRKNKKIQLED